MTDLTIDRPAGVNHILRLLEESKIREEKLSAEIAYLREHGCLGWRTSSPPVIPYDPSEYSVDK